MEKLGKIMQGKWKIWLIMEEKIRLQEKNCLEMQGIRKNKIKNTGKNMIARKIEE